MQSPFETGPQRYQPPGDYTYAHDPRLRFDQRRLARVVGAIALGMPVVLGLGGLALGRFRVALSEYYYEPLGLGDVFVGCLVAIGALLMAYRGWSPKVAQLASLAGLAALVVAFVPMGGWAPDALPRECGLASREPQCAEVNFLYPVLGYWLHAGAAGTLFAILSFFCIFVFTKVPADPSGAPGTKTPAKRRRNRIYIASGIIIALSAISIALGDQLAHTWWQANAMTFWMEAVILAAFGVSWLTQGRALPRLNDPRDRADAALAQTARE